jgi:T5SS/PEP-CTERM-associated repeat protein
VQARTLRARLGPPHGVCGGKYTHLAFSPLPTHVVGLLVPNFVGEHMTNMTTTARPVNAPLAAALLLSAGLCHSLAPRAHAATLNWNNALGGSAGTAANWNPAQVPTAADTLVFDLAATYSTTFPLSVMNSTQWNVRRGTVTAGFTGTHTVSGSLSVGETVGSTGRLDVNIGTLAIGANATIGSNLNTLGEFRVVNGGAALDLTGVALQLTVGRFGGGTMRVLDGGVVSSVAAVVVGASAAATGTGSLIVAGFDTLPASSSSFSITSNAPMVIGQGGTGNLQVLTGGQIDVAGDLTLGQLPGGVGAANVNGAGLVDAAIRAANLRIGERAGGFSAGTGGLTVSNDGVVDISGTTTIGDDQGGSGTLTINSGGLFATRNLTLSPGNNTLALNGGFLDINAGVLNAGNQPIIIAGTTANPAIRLNNGATSTNIRGASNASVALGVGITSSAGLRIEGPGSAIAIPVGAFMVGQNAGSNGQVIIDGGSLTVPAAAQTTIGRSGNASVIVAAGGSLACGITIIGETGPGTASLQITNPGSSATIEALLTVGGAAGMGGDADLILSDGGSLTINSSFAPCLRINPTGSLTMTNASITVVGGGSINVQGPTNMNNSFITGAGGMSFTGTAPITLSGGISTSSTLGMNPGANASLQGPFTVTGGFNIGSTLTVGTHPLTVNAGTLRVLSGATLTINGTGTISAPLPASIDSGGTLSGTGTFRGSLNNNGTISATGNGITFENGTITGVGQAMSGTAFTFNNIATFAATGTVNADVRGDATAVINATGPLTLGRTSSASGVDFRGALNVNSQVVTLRDADGIVLPTLVNFGTAGRIDLQNAGNIVTLQSDSTMIGNGLLQFTTLGPRFIQSLGVIAPGAAPNGIGRIRFDTQGFFHAGPLQMDLASPTSSDEFIISGGGAFNLPPGGSLQVSLGFTPSAPFRRTLITASSIVGTFTSITLPPVPLGQLRIDYTPTTIDLVYCPADFNADFSTDFFDYLDFVAAFDIEDPAADFNGDSAVDFFDYLDFVAAFDTGC